MKTTSVKPTADASPPVSARWRTREPIRSNEGFFGSRRVLIDMHSRSHSNSYLRDVEIVAVNFFTVNPQQALSSRRRQTLAA
jgi:hypothetical protein